MNKRNLRAFAKVVMLSALIFLMAPLQLFGLPDSKGENYQESITITGTITEYGSDLPLPGVSILIKGTTKGTITDIKGKYSITANVGDVLVYSFMGYTSEEITVGSETEINVELVESAYDLDELIVVGYGVQKKKLNTGATLNLGGEDIQALNTTSAMDALKGLSPGVSITQTSGMPGADSKIYIRGIGTIGNANPLYIVDGIAVGSIDNLSPSDIESIDILKDAASAAIYGSRGANGVILVTTRQGKKSAAPVVNYSGYYGIQNVYQGPELLNAQKYIEMMDIANENAGRPANNYESMIPDWSLIQSGEWEGTNWFDEITEKNAPVQSHSLNITGGSESSTFSMGASYYNQQGILGKQANNDYKRLNFRLNSEHILYKNKDRNIITLGENFTFTNEKNPTLRSGGIYWSDIHNIVVAPPVLPMYATEADDEAFPYHAPIDWAPLMINPVGNMVYQSKWNTNNNNNIIANAHLNISPINGLTIRSAFGVNSWNGSSRLWHPKYYLGPSDKADFDRVEQKMYSGYSWTNTNTATYTKGVGKHNFSAMVGNEMQKNVKSLSLKARQDSSWFSDPDYGYLDNFDPLGNANGQRAKLGGRDDYGWGMASYFGRFSYNYNETYLATIVARWDGSSNFTVGNRWSNFNSISAGWVISNETFMDNTKSWLSMAKLRASWGENGNQDIDRFAYLSSISLKNNYYFFGPDYGTVTIGSTPARVPNPDVHWETQQMTNIGLDLNFMNNRLQTTLEWYKRVTKDWLVQKISSQMDGTEAPFVNGGSVENMGMEAMVSWNDTRGDLKYGATITIAYNKNEVVEMPSEDSILHGINNYLAENTKEFFRAETGYPIGYFWGYETDGILQNDEEAAAWVRPEGSVDANGDDVSGQPYFDGSDLRNQQLPGDLKFVDQNGDGLINDDDKVMIGNPHPDFIIGLQIHLDYRGFYASMTGNGMLGHEIARNYRGVNSFQENYTQYEYDNVWREDNTSGTLPRLYRGSHRNYQEISDIYILKGNFFRISNLTIGYDLSNLEFVPFREVKIYVAANNLMTITKYPGMDPEIGFSPEDENNPDKDFPWASGIDLGLYPQSRTFMIGANITF
jgi:TonB-linked SusC/RagA family outer membrane protein